MSCDGTKQMVHNGFHQIECDLILKRHACILNIRCNGQSPKVVPLLFFVCQKIFNCNMFLCKLFVGFLELVSLCATMLM